MLPNACRAYRRSLLIDGLAGLALAHDHPEACSECRQFRDAERAVSAAIHDGRPRWVASVALRERIVAAVEAERHRADPRRRRSRRVALQVAVGAFAAAAAIVVYLAWPRGADPQAEAHALAELLVDDHLQFEARRDRLELATSSPVELQAWFQREVAIAPRLPKLGGASLTGGRSCRIGGRPAALAFYQTSPADLAPEPLSLFVFAAGDEDWSAMHEVPGLAGKRMCRYHERGIGLLIWQERGLVYAVAGALDPDALRALLLPPDQ